MYRIDPCLFRLESFQSDLIQTHRAHVLSICVAFINMHFLFNRIPIKKNRSVKPLQHLVRSCIITFLSKLYLGVSINGDNQKNVVLVS